MATRKEEIDRLRHETGSNDPLIAESARRALSEMGRKGGKVTAEKRRQEKLGLAARAEAYRIAAHQGE